MSRRADLFDPEGREVRGEKARPFPVNAAAGQPRQITGRPLNQRTAPPPAKAISADDYAGNFAAVLDAAAKDAPWCF